MSTRAYVLGLIRRAHPRVLASLKTFQRMWITWRDYKEIGLQIIHRCF